MDPILIRVDDLTHPGTVALVNSHLADMHAQTPPESVHALGIDALQDPDITVWSAWNGSEVVGVVALRRMDGTAGEIKSMRVADAHRGTGIGRALLEHVILEARHARCTHLYLETGSGPEFLPARSLYLSEGFTECGSFGDYRPDPLSTFMVRAL